MAAQMRHLTDVAALPNVTLTVIGAVIHPANESGFVIADNAAYAEHVAGGYVFTEEEPLLRWPCGSIRFGQKATGPSESLALIERNDPDMGDWRKSSYSGSNGGQCVEVAVSRVRNGPGHCRPRRHGTGIQRSGMVSLHRVAQVRTTPGSTLPESRRGCLRLRPASRVCTIGQGA